MPPELCYRFLGDGEGWCARWLCRTGIGLVDHAESAKIGAPELSPPIFGGRRGLGMREGFVVLALAPVHIAEIAEIDASESLSPISRRWR